MLPWLKCISTCPVPVLHYLCLCKAWLWTECVSVLEGTKISTKEGHELWTCTGTYILKEDLLKGLTDEQIQKAKCCKNDDELLALAKKEGIELTEEQLECVSGGGCGYVVDHCPACNSENICLAPNRTGSDVGKTLYYCRDCKSYFFYEED